MSTHLYRFIPRLARRTLPSPLLAALLLGAAVVAPAEAASFNVSEIVLGTMQPWPHVLVGAPTYPCDSACQYVTTSSTGLANTYTLEPAPYTANVWPPVYGNSQPGIGAVAEALAVPPAPDGQTQDGGAIGVQRRAAVDFQWQPVLGGTRRMSVQTWKTGSGANTVAMAIRLTTPRTGAQPTYLEFDVPKLTRGWQEAYFVGGPSGYQPMYTDPRRVQTRSAVDIYVNGLPVWSSEANLLRPQRDNEHTQFLQWGPELADDTVTLFLGSLPAGSQRTVTMLIRTELRTDAPTCKYDTENFTSYERCHSQMESLTLPANAVSSGGGAFQFLSYVPSMRIYTR